MSTQISFLAPDKIEKSKSAQPKRNREKPAYRLRTLGPQALSDAELIACLLQTHDALQRAADIVAKYDIWSVEPERIPDLTQAQVTRLRAALEIGRRFTTYQAPKRPTINHPGDIAALLMPLHRPRTTRELRRHCHQHPQPRPGHQNPLHRHPRHLHCPHRRGH